MYYHLSDPDEIICLDEVKNKETFVEAPKQPLTQIDTKKIRQEAIMGQIPQKIQKEADVENEAIDTEKINENLDEDRDLHPTRMSKTQYLNPSKNPHGRVVFSPDPNRGEFYDKGTDPRIHTTYIEKHGNVRMFMGKLHFCKNL